MLLRCCSTFSSHRLMYLKEIRDLGSIPGPPQHDVFRPAGCVLTTWPLGPRGYRLPTKSCVMSSWTGRTRAAVC
ncbi:hypothetical protein EYF80_052920 [Liparis tanakae]|uniref:Uncharacterized protein n=1 Tax=Liparis tanakae TaxID=230148 RepID=A0A4Z2F6X9_9TELE|nr:hypothetical protein EYF80_052920 [Liparis tanakae]